MTHQKVVLPFRENFTGWRNGLKEISLCSTKGRMKSCTWTKITSLYATGQPAEKDLEVLVGQ